MRRFRSDIAGMSLSRTLRSQPRWALLLEMSVLLALIGWLDRITSWELSLFVFYAVPIFTVVWVVERRWGLLLAVLSAGVWWVANRFDNPYETSWGFAVATFSRLAYFLFVAVGAAALRAQRDADGARILALERTRQLEAEIVQVSEREQRRIGRDLHDGLCQYLAAVSLSAKSLAKDLTEEKSRHAREADEIAALLMEAVGQARSLARAAFPVQMDGAGLSIALDEMAATTRRLTSLNVSFEEKGDTRLDDPQVATQLFRIAQEALGNALKHSAASQIVVSLHRENGQLALTIGDNGKGFARQPVAGSGLGMETMSYRARSIGADLNIKSQPGSGTQVTCSLRINPATDHDSPT